MIQRMLIPTIFHCLPPLDESADCTLDSLVVPMCVGGRPVLVTSLSGVVLVVLVDDWVCWIGTDDVVIGEGDLSLFSRVCAESAVVVGFWFSLTDVEETMEIGLARVIVFVSAGVVEVVNSLVGMRSRPKSRAETV